MRKIAGMVLVGTVIAGCASPPEEIPSSYVSTLQYRNYDCDQLSMESERVTRRANMLQAQLKKTADDDAAQMGIGLVLFWPALFALEGGDGAAAQEYGRLKGERDAIEEAAIQKKCMIDMPPLDPIEPPENQDTKTDATAERR